MKKCPTCEKTFDDALKFCQIDGTPLVDDAPAFDPYATIVGRPGEISAPAESPAEAESEAPSVDSSEPVPAAIEAPDDVLDIADNADPLKTMFASDSEMKEALGQVDDDDEAPELEVPSAAEPEMPKFSQPEIAAPSFGAPPPSPFSPSEPVEETPAEPPVEFQSTNPPIPSPFDAPSIKVDDPVPAEPENVMQAEAPVVQIEEPAAPPPFAEPDPVEAIQANPFEPSNTPAEWTPPPAPDASWQNQEIGSNTPFQPPAAGAVGQNKMLPIVSLVLGIVSLCCYVSPLTGIAALVTGFLGMKNANNDPDNYGGKGLAIAGMVLGGLFALIGLAYWIFLIFFGGLGLLMDAMR